MRPAFEYYRNGHKHPDTKGWDRSTGHACRFQTQDHRNGNRVRLCCNVSRSHPRSAACGRQSARDGLAGWWTCDFVRHGATFADQADTDPFNFDNISTQRNLNDSGKTLARAFGEALRQAGVPVGKVYTSKFNRAYETATIAGFTDIEKTADLTEGGLVVTPNENNRRAEALRKLLATAPKPGTNTVLITHKPNILDALGKDWFDVKEGEASIFRPETGKYVLVARLQMADWPHVAAAAKQ